MNNKINRAKLPILRVQGIPRVSKNGLNEDLACVWSIPQHCDIALTQHYSLAFHWYMHPILAETRGRKAMRSWPYFPWIMHHSPPVFAELGWWPPSLCILLKMSFLPLASSSRFFTLFPFLLSGYQGLCWAQVSSWRLRLWFITSTFFPKRITSKSACAAWGIDLQLHMHPF